MNTLQIKSDLLRDADLHPMNSGLKNKSMSVFGEHGRYISGKRLFFSYFEAIPSIVKMHSIHHDKAMRWVEKEYGDRILHKHFATRSLLNPKPDSRIVNVIYVLTQEVIIDIEQCGSVGILFSEKSESFAGELEIELKKFQLKNKGRNQYNLLIETIHGLELVPVKNKKPKLDLALNYNNDLSKIHTSLLKTLNTRDKSGLFLFHGIPGTGKSTYIRFLIHKIKKKVIFIPPRMVANLDSPNMTGILLENPNSVFIIEDAEELIKSREGSGNSNISMLLNLTDGMLGESLGIQVICTFNTHTNNIDEALLRKGRLSVMYQFKSLDKSKAEVLLHKLGNTDYPVSKDMTLADIYNVQQAEFNPLETNKIGFLTS